MVDLHNE